MKKTAVFLCLLFLALSVSALASDPPPETSARSMILVHADSGMVLTAVDPDTPRPMASTTKLMTALLAAETLPSDAVCEIRPEWTRIEGSSAYLQPGEQCTVRELLEGLLLASGNDAALALAGMTAGSPDGFAERMNARARELGMGNTHFANAHGLSAEDHYSTARDLAALMTEVLKNDLLRGVMAQQSAAIRGRVYTNHNRLLGLCPGVDGGKTGYTKAAGRCLVSTCCREGLRLICVTLSDPADWADHEALYDWAYGLFRVWRFSDEARLPEIPVILDPEHPARPVPAEDVCLCAEKDAAVDVRWSLPPYLVALPLNGPAGEAAVCVDGKETARVPLIWGQ